MFDEKDGNVAVFDFNELSDHLLEQGLQQSPSELHGCLCGLLAAGASPQAEAGLDALGLVLDMNLHGELAAQAMQLYAVTAAALEDEEFDFHPLLPADDEEIATRTASLGHWSRGFLAGFAHETARVERTRGTLSSDSSEILKDFAAIAQAEVDDEADEEESESSYAELVEYLRFAALNVYMDSRSQGQDKGGPGERGQPMH